MVIMRLFKTRPYVVFHPESPGVKVLVFRNWIQDLIYPKDFASSAEYWYYDSLHVGINRTEDKANEDPSCT